MWNDADRGARRARLRLGAALIVAAVLALPAHDAADAKSRGERTVAAPVVAPPLEPALRGVPLDPAWPKHVYVITDSVMLGAKQSFIKGLPDWQVTYDGRPALMIRKALDEYVRGQRNTGPIAVVALGYNTLWEKNRRDFKRWSDRFDKDVEDMLAALKERGARKIVWVMLRELSPDLITSGGVSLSQYNRYAWYFPYVNERLRAIKARHPEMALADWAGAARQTGVTYDAIHLNPRGADLMTEVVKVAMGIGDTQSKAPVQAPAPAVVPVAPIVEVRPIEQAPPPRPEVARAETPSNTAPKKWSHRNLRQSMFALSKIGSAPVVMLGDSLTERAQWSEITGCRFVANRGIGADDSAGVLRRLDDVTKLKPEAVFLMIGVNDVASNVPTEKIVDNVQQTIERLTSAGAQVYLTLVLPVTDGFPRKINPKVAELNAAYRRLAAETRATVVDFRATMQTDGGFLRDEMSLDGIHLTNAGYRVWRDAVAPLVMRHCAPDSAPDMVAIVPKPRTPAVTETDTSLTTATIPPARSATARGGWIIQIGAFPEEDKAKERIREAQSLGGTVLANANPFTEKVVKGRQELYRARFAGFNQSAAEAACSYFKRNAIDCITVRN